MPADEDQVLDLYINAGTRGKVWNREETRFGPGVDKVWNKYGPGRRTGAGPVYQFRLASSRGDRGAQAENSE